MKANINSVEELHRCQFNHVNSTVNVEVCKYILFTYYMYDVPGSYNLPAGYLANQILTSVLIVHYRLFLLVWFHPNRHYNKRIG